MKNPTQFLKNLFSTISGLNKFTPTMIGQKYKLKYIYPMKLGAMPTEDQSSIEKDNIHVSSLCILTVTNESRTLIELRVSSNMCAIRHNNTAQNGRLVWYQKDLFKNLDKKQL